MPIKPAAPQSYDRPVATAFRRFQQSSLFLILSSVLGGLAIAIYILSVGQLVSHRSNAETLNRVVLAAAHELEQVTVENSALGLIGLTDLPTDIYLHGSTRQRVIGINSVYGVLRLDALVANKLHHPFLTALINKDLLQAKKNEKELVEKLKQTVAESPVYLRARERLFSFTNHDLNGEKNQFSNRGSNYIYQQILQELSANANRNESLVSAHVRLGFLRDSLAESHAKAPAGTDITCIDEHGEYRTGVPIPITHFGLIMFTPLAPQTTICNPGDFVSDSRDSAPTAILIEATYRLEKTNATNQSKLLKLSACAAVGSPAISSPPSCLLVGFPQGMPNCFHSIHDILFFNGWKNQTNWRQAINGEIPGTGLLVPVIQPPLPAMSPSDALAVAVYHWIRLLDTNCDPQKCLQLLCANFDLASFNSAPSPPLDLESTKPDNAFLQVNSCLARDSDTRCASVLNQTYPGGIGAQAINKLFASNHTTQSMGSISAPPSALPLCIDKHGNCYLAGNHSFDPQLITDFLGAIYETNLAALESLSTAKFMHSQSLSARNQAEQKLAIDEQELNSINSRLGHSSPSNKQPAAGQPTYNSPPTIFKQSILLKEQIGKIDQAINQDRQEIERQNQLIGLATIAQSNANKVADWTFDLCAHAGKLCKGGIITETIGGNQIYLISKKTLFYPIKKPLSEFDFYEASSSLNKNQFGLINSAKPLSWLNSNMTFSQELSQILQNGTSGKDPCWRELWKTINTKEPTQESLMPRTIVYDSQALLGKKPLKPIAIANYPFYNVFIPNGQLFYYCQGALKTGCAPQVSWSVLVRDLVASRLEGNLGLPINSSEEDWCKQKGQAIGVCPGLACEFQLRTPLPVLDNFPPGSYLTNTQGNQVAQIPPVPPDLL